jgi:cell division protein FtsI (penicillin-binding protein 3)
MQAPRYAIYVMVDEPKPNARSHGYATAGWVAAPAAGMVIRSVAPILGMVPEIERAEEIQASIAIPLQPGRPAGPRAASPRSPAPAAQPPAPAAPTTAAAPARSAAPALPAAQREAALAAR